MPNANEMLKLRVRDEDHYGWTSVNVQTAIEQLASEFAISLTETWPDEPGVTYPGMVYPGDSCEILIGDDLVFTGWIETPNIGHAAREHTIEAGGRSKTCDIVDCSCLPPYQFKNRTLEQIAIALCEPYGVRVLDWTETTDKIKRFSPETGETVFDALERLARDGQVLLTDDEAGNLVITRVGTEKGPDFKHPGNILRAQLLTDVSQRFSEYTVKGQTVGDDENYGAVVAHAAGEAQDFEAVVGRRRVRVIRGERQMNPAACKRRAIWEAVTRAGRSAQVEITVRGWRDADGNLYRKNTISHVEDPVIGVDADLLVVGVTYTLDSEGTLAVLRMAPPGAYETIEPVKRKYRIERGIRALEAS